jgi:hypothetical protein
LFEKRERPVLFFTRGPFAKKKKKKKKKTMTEREGKWTATWVLDDLEERHTQRALLMFCFENGAFGDLPLDVARAHIFDRIVDPQWNFVWRHTGRRRPWVMEGPKPYAFWHAALNVFRRGLPFLPPGEQLFDVVPSAILRGEPSKHVFLLSDVRADYQRTYRSEGGVLQESPPDRGVWCIASDPEDGRVIIPEDMPLFEVRDEGPLHLHTGFHPTRLGAPVRDTLVNDYQYMTPGLTKLAERIFWNYIELYVTGFLKAGKARRHIAATRGEPPLKRAKTS